MKRNSKRFMRLMISLVAALTLIAGTMVTSFAAEANENVTNDRNGVVQIKVMFQGTDKDYFVSWGTGFLINESTVLTCHHVVYADDYVIQAIREDEHLGPMVSGKTDKQIREKMAILVTVYAESSVTAEVIEGVQSDNADFVALKLKTPLTDYTPLKIRDTKADPVNPTEPCFVLGFPYIMQILKGDNANKFAPENVEVTPGTVKQMDTMDLPEEDMEHVMNVTMTGTTSAGYSGGPMVDNDGNVIGIAHRSMENQTLATATQEFLPVLTTIGIEYTAADGSAAATEEKKDEGTEEAAEEVPEPAPVPAEPEKKTNYIPFIIGGAAVVLLGILAAVLLSKKGKKNAPAAVASTYASGGPAPVNLPTGSGMQAGGAPSVPPAVGYGGGPTPDTSVLNQGSNETTVLGQGAGETSVLSQTQVSGSLTRAKTGEKVNITRENFKIGRERSRVDYCISDNTAIGRHHATIIVRNGDAYLVDQNSRNFTFVNDVKVAPNVETKLKEGDKISFGDEVYTYHAK